MAVGVDPFFLIGTNASICVCRQEVTLGIAKTRMESLQMEVRLLQTLLCCFSIADRYLVITGEKIPG